MTKTVKGAIVTLMSREELDRGLELARIAGEMWTVSDLAALLDMPMLADFLEERGMRLQEIAVDQLLRSTGTRADGSFTLQPGHVLFGIQKSVIICDCSG